jgi:hypothetical protein
MPQLQTQTKLYNSLAVEGECQSIELKATGYNKS